MKKAAIYMRTQDCGQGRRQGRGQRRRHSCGQCGDISADQIPAEITRLTAYAEKKGYEVYKIYLDNGYNGTNSSCPAHGVMYRDKLSGDFDAVIVANAPTAEERSTFPLMLDAFQTVLIADIDRDGEEYYREHAEQWLLEALERGQKDIDEGRGLSSEEVHEHLQAHMEEMERRDAVDRAAAYEVKGPSRYGENVIEAQAAMWLLKNGYKDDLLPETI